MVAPRAPPLSCCLARLVDLDSKPRREANREGRETLIPVSDETRVTEEGLAIAAEAAKKSAIVWVAIADGTPTRARCVWHVFHEGSIYVLIDGGSGDSGEQVVPGLASARRVTVTARSKDKGVRLATWAADVTTVAPKGDEWDAVLPLLQAARLNGPDYAAAPARWADKCTLLRLQPSGDVLEQPGEMSSSSHAAPPVDSPATTRVPVPFTVHRRPRRRRSAD